MWKDSDDSSDYSSGVDEEEVVVIPDDEYDLIKKER